MTLSEQERLSFDYLSGSLSPAAEQDFYIQLALDSELQQTLKAMQIVERAIHKDRTAATIAHTQSREHVLASLGRSAAAQAGTAITGTATASTASSIQRGLSALSASSVQWALAAVAVTCLAIGTFIIAPMMHDNSNASVEVVPVSRTSASEISNQTPTLQVVPSSTPQRKFKPVARIAAPVAASVVADTTTQPLTPVSSTKTPRIIVSEKDTIKLRVKIEPGSK